MVVQYGLTAGMCLLRRARSETLASRLKILAMTPILIHAFMAVGACRAAGGGPPPGDVYDVVQQLRYSCMARLQRAASQTARSRHGSRGVLYTRRCHAFMPDSTHARAHGATCQLQSCCAATLIHGLVHGWSMVAYCRTVDAVECSLYNRHAVTAYNT